MIKLEPNGEIAVVRLDNKTSNAVNLDLVEQLSETLEVVKQKYRAMVLAGNSRFFSMGFDLPDLISLDRKRVFPLFPKVQRDSDFHFDPARAHCGRPWRSHHSRGCHTLPGL